MALLSKPWSEYGSYLETMQQTVQQQWYDILMNTRKAPPYGSGVIVTFKINSKGETDIVRVDDLGSGKNGIRPCLEAIQAKQPYPKWTDAMIASLGHEQTLTFAFYYK